jgi:uncharacterized protein
LRRPSDGLKLRGIVLRQIHGMQGSVRYSTLALPLPLLMLMLGGCEAGNFGTRPSESTRAPAEVGAASQHRQAAQALEASARKADPDARDDLLQRAAEEWYAGADLRRAMRALEASSALPGTDATPVLQLLSARVELERNLPQRALERVMKMARPLPPALTAEALDVEGRARFALGDGGGGVTALVARETWLSDGAALRANERAIWDALQRPGLSLKAPAGADATVRGWLDLARIAAGRDTATLRPELLAWREHYPKHPANGTLLTQWLADARHSVHGPQRLALLLPLSGRLEQAAAAVRDGFLTAYFDADAAADTDARPEILVFDTAQMGPEGAYEAAVRAGADFVVGPLEKSAVSRVAAIEHGVPVLALNNLADEQRAPAAFYQFALAPEEEAEQIAQRALADGHGRALALVSSDEWGQRLLESFSRALERGGGRLIAYQAFDPNANDHQYEIKRLLALDEAQARYRALAATLGENLQFEARPRQDADFVFLGAQAPQARLLRPELRFHFADKLPIYATSSVYEPPASANEDLDGITFADMPWVIDRAEDDPLRTALRELSGTDWQRRARLYALGYDAYRFVPLLYDGPERARLAGATGLLSVERDGHVHRELAFAQMHHGAPQAAPDAAVVVPEPLEPPARP